MRATAVLLLVALAPLRLGSDEPKPPAKITVSVVAILASDQHERVVARNVRCGRLGSPAVAHHGAGLVRTLTAVQGS